MTQTPGGSATRRQPCWLFTVIDIASGVVITEDATARATIDALATVDAIFDVWIYVYEPTHPPQLRLLTPGEHRMLWNFRGCPPLRDARAE